MGNAGEGGTAFIVCSVSVRRPPAPELDERLGDTVYCAIIYCFANPVVFVLRSNGVRRGGSNKAEAESLHRATGMKDRGT